MAQLNSDSLSSKQAQQRLAQYGPNILPGSPPPSVLNVFIHQFNSPFVYVLLAAVILSAFLGQMINAFFILVVLFINAVIGTVQEFSAEQAALALKNMVPSYATVVRDGKSTKISSREVVPGDLVLLAPGDKVPADVRLRSNSELQLDESMLTGESVAVYKRLSCQDDDEQEMINEDRCFAGTVVMSGRGSGNVISTGADTEIGRIAAEVKTQQTKPPLLLRIEKFTLRITYGILLMIALIFVITLSRGDDLGTVFLLGVALAVSAIPEGLPAAITVALAIGMRRMARVQVIIRNLLAVESLGSCTYIASDKTGTLTVNEMTIKHIGLVNGCQYDIAGEGLDLRGEIMPVGNRMKDDRDERDDRELELLIQAGVLANESYLVERDSGCVGEGDMVDVAFLVLAKKQGIDYRAARQQSPELAQVPYESEKAFCASINHFQGKTYLFVKGSVETLLAMSHANEPRDAIGKQADGLAGEGYRVLGLGYRLLEAVPEDIKDVLNELKFLGMVGMIDPLRPEVKQAVSECKTAHIQVAMITGDHPQTAMALALQSGIGDPAMVAVTGRKLEQAYEQGADDFSRCVHSTKVFARVSPHQKRQIIEQLMFDGDFVAVTGDGVNDAPALSHAHVGIAMGLRGTDVARESADIILTDDNFASIVQGIKQGRIVYNNIRKVIFLLISTGAAEILLVLFSLLFGTPLPLFPLQLLWLNLVTNGIQDVALAFEPAEGDELQQRARPPKQPIFNRLMIERVAVNAVVMGCLAFGLFKWQLDMGIAEFEARNMTLLLMVLFENVHVLNSRSEHQSITRQYFFGNKFLLFGMLAAQGVHIGAMYTPGLNSLLAISPVSFEQWSTLLLVALVLIVVDESHKYAHQRQRRQ